MHAQVWYRDPSQLWRDYRVTPLTPAREASFVRRLNSLVRIVLVVCVLTWAATMDARPLVLAGLTMFASWVAWESAAGSKAEAFADYSPDDAPRAVPGSDLSIDRNGVVRRKPTPANPTMNRTYGMAMPAGDGVRAEDPADRATRQRMVDAMDEAGMLPPKDDDMNRRKVIRDFYTVPSMGAVPDRRQDYLDFMYGDLDQNNNKMNSVHFSEEDSKIRGDPTTEVF